jgi:ATP-binding cassette subfamily B protein
LGFLLGNDIGYEIFRRSLYQPYSIHLNRNSSEIIDAVSSKTNNVIYSVIMPILSLISSAVMLSFIIVALFFVNPVATISTFLIFGASYLAVTRLTKRKLQINSELISTQSVSGIKIVQEGLGGIRDVLADRTQELYCRIYRECDLRLRGAQASSAFIGGSPRFVMEALGMVLISAFAYSLAVNGGGLAAAIPILGVFALGAQRMLPLIQQSYSSYVSIRTGQAALREVLDLLEQPMPAELVSDKSVCIQFHNELELKSAFYRYNEQMPWVLRDANLKIKKGSRIGIVGSTGSGKSTLMDVLMSLLSLEKGSLVIDGVKINGENIDGWRKKIAHVPQHIFLSDCSIAENIAL